MFFSFQKMPDKSRNVHLFKFCYKPKLFVFKKVPIFKHLFTNSKNVYILFSEIKNVWEFKNIQILFTNSKMFWNFKNYSHLQICSQIQKHIFIFKICSHIQKMFIFENLCTNSKCVRMFNFCSQILKYLVFQKCSCCPNLFTYSKKSTVLKICSQILKMFLFSEFCHKFKKCSSFLKIV